MTVSWDFWGLRRLPKPPRLCPDHLQAGLLPEALLQKQQVLESISFLFHYLLTSHLPEHPGAEHWPNIRAAGAGVSGLALAVLPQFGISVWPSCVHAWGTLEVEEQ